MYTISETYNLIIAYFKRKRIKIKYVKENFFEENNVFEIRKRKYLYKINSRQGITLKRKFVREFVLVVVDSIYGFR